MANIEVLKKDLVTLAKIVKKVDKALEDGKVSMTEGIGIGFSAIDLIGVVKTIKDAQVELVDLDPAEVSELVEVFKKEFDLRNDRAEELIEQVIELGLQIVVAADLFHEDGE